MKIHLMGVAGTGMASLAGMLKAMGHQVKGSDQEIYPPMSHLLEELGIDVFCPYEEKNLDWNPDLVVIGNVISRGNPEAETVLTKSIPYLSMPQTIRKFFLSGKTSLVVAGTHGKTTTTAMMAWILESAGFNPSFFLGGKPRNFPSNFQLGEGPFFVLEGDEYDTAFFDKGPKFLHYEPQHVLLTSVEFDHADIYQNLDQILESFRKLLKLLPPEGSLVANLDYPEVRSLVREFPGKVISYAMNEAYRDRADYFGEVLSTGEKMRFCIQSRGEDGKFQHREVKWNLPGRYNVSNALGVTALAFAIGLQWEQIHQGLVTFRGVHRRQEIFGEARGIVLVDDFAHHPTAVRETVQGIRDRFPSSRLWAIFEPRSNTSKRDIFQDEYAKSFSGADKVLIADVFRPEKVKEGRVLDVDRLVEKIKENGVPEARHISGVEGMVQTLVKEGKAGDVFLFMSNGDFGEVGPKTLKVLASQD